MNPYDAAVNQRVVVAGKYRGTIIRIVREQHDGCKIRFDASHLGERWTPWTLVQSM